MMKLSVFNEHCFFDILEVTGWVGARRGAVLGYPHNQKLLNFSESRSNFFLKKCIQNYRETQFSKSYCSPWMSICKKCTETYYFLLRWLDFFSAYYPIEILLYLKLKYHIVSSIDNTYHITDDPVLVTLLEKIVFKM